MTREEANRCRCDREDAFRLVAPSTARGQSGTAIRMRSIVSGAAMACCALSSFPCAADSAVPSRSILVLDEANVRGPFYYEVFSGLRTAVNANSRSPVTIYVESLDLSRFGGAAYEDSLRDHFRSKYRDKSIGVLVAIGVGTLDYVLRWRTELWPGAPVVFAMVDESTTAGLKLPADITGVVMKLRFQDMMVAAHAVVPTLKRIVLVGDSLQQGSVWRHFATEIPIAAADVEVIDLTGLPMRELRKRITALPEHSAILYTGIYSDGEGTYFPPADALASVAEVANRPIIVTAETFLGRGAVGGFLLIPTAIGEAAARVALRVLDGEAVSEIPITTGNVVRPVFDWRQLQRWHVNEARLPPGSEVRFRDPTTWEQYRLPITAACTVVAIQATMITLLLYERRRRRRLERSAGELSGRLISAAEEERARLARELHDDVTQRLASLAIDAAREQRNPGGAAGAGAMKTMRERLVRLSEDVHALSYRLHPSLLEDLGLFEALQHECGRFSRTCSTRLEIDAQDIPPDLPDDVALCLFRIAQEGLRNIARHAKAARAEVRLRRWNGGLQLEVRDDGIGFEAVRHRNGPSLGHASMRQRAVLLGGKVEIESSPSRGTLVRAWVPLKGKRHEPSARAAG